MIINAQPHINIHNCLSHTQSDKQRFQGHWFTAEPQESLINLISGRADADKLLDGVLGFAFISDTTSRGYMQFESDWYAQPSTATMDADGNMQHCSDERDELGYYLWREDGLRDGQCLGIDFDTARAKRASATCGTDDPVCDSASIWHYMPFVYDSVIAMASGLDQLLEREGVPVADITGPQLIDAIVRRPFDGASGNVTLLPNGDRRPIGLHYTLLNYHGTGKSTGGWKHIGQFVDGANYIPCTASSDLSQTSNCAHMRFRGGQTTLPRVEQPSTRTIRIGGLFPFYDDTKGAGANLEAGTQMMAALMAVNAVNDKNNPYHGHLLPNYKLELLPRDSKGNSKHSTTEAFDLVYKLAAGILGPAAFKTTAAVQSLLQLPMVHVAQITYAAANPALSDDSEYSILARTPPVDSAEMQAQVIFMMQNSFNWTCVNRVVAQHNSEAVAASVAFTKASVPYSRLDAGVIFSLRQEQDDMSTLIEALGNSLCRITALFADVDEIAKILVEADRQKYPGVWFVGDEVMRSQRKLAELIGPDAPRLLNGMMSTRISNGKGSDRYFNFEEEFLEQSSTARMDPMGIPQSCSAAVDSTGYHIWRKDGAPDGDCFGIDFKQALKKLRNGECTEQDRVCTSARLSTFAPFVYDAVIAMATGLDRLLEHEDMHRTDISGKHLFDAMVKYSNFTGVSGHVSFTPQGDRQVHDFEAIVYNYHGGVEMGNNTGFEPVGRLRREPAGNLTYTPCTELASYGTSGPRDCGSKSEEVWDITSGREYWRLFKYGIEQYDSCI